MLVQLTLPSHSGGFFIMIKYEFTTLFDPRSPILEQDEDELRFDHPLHPIYTNQIGVIRTADPEKWMSNYSFNYMAISSDDEVMVRLPVKTKLVYECYHQTLITQGHVLQINANALDYTLENLVYIGSHNSEIYKNYKKLTEELESKTIQYMIGRSVFLKKLGKNPERYWELAEVDSKLFNKWKNLFKHYL